MDITLIMHANEGLLDMMLKLLRSPRDAASALKVLARSCNVHRKEICTNEWLFKEHRFDADRRISLDNKISDKEKTENILGVHLYIKACLLCKLPI